MAIVVKSAFANTCIAVICLGAIAVMLAENRDQEKEQNRREQREFEIELLQETYFPYLYNKINRDHFGGQLPTDVLVSWADLRSNADCGGCGGITDYDSGRPAIRINTDKVKTEKSLRELDAIFLRRFHSALASLNNRENGFDSCVYLDRLSIFRCRFVLPLTDSVDCCLDKLLRSPDIFDMFHASVDANRYAQHYGSNDASMSCFGRIRAFGR